MDCVIFLATHKVRKRSRQSNVATSQSLSLSLFARLSTFSQSLRDKLSLALGPQSSTVQAERVAKLCVYGGPYSLVSNFYN
jgi:hypothetical protein